MRASVVRNDSEPYPLTEADKALLLEGRIRASEGRIRVFVPDDIPEVASLHDRIFGGGDGKPSDRFCECFEDLFFKNPWADPLVPSWVYENNKGDIKAFVASHPRRMLFDGEPLMCAAHGSWMVAEDYRGRGLGLLILRHVLEMGPTFSYCDTAGRLGIAVWEYCGGARVQIAGLRWEYVLRGGRMNDSADGGSKVMRLPSRIVNEMRLRRRRTLIEQQVKNTGISEVAPDLSGGLSEMLRTETRLYPRYDAEYASWLIKVASSIFSRGELRHSIVTGHEGGGIDGWYFFWVAENARAEVLQIVSKQGAADRVLAQLIAHANREGAVSVAGSWCGHDTLVAAETMGCYIGYVPSRTVVYTRNTEIMRAMMCGDYFLSAFEGDNWLGLRNR